MGEFPLIIRNRSRAGLR